MPWPPATHMVSRPYCLSSVSRSFSSVVMMRAPVCPNGWPSAIALGHPFGMTGVRIMTTLLNGLEADDKTIGLETMCVAGGQGEAMIVERLS